MNACARLVLLLHFTKALCNQAASISGHAPWARPPLPLARRSLPLMQGSTAPPPRLAPPPPPLRQLSAAPLPSLLPAGVARTGQSQAQQPPRHPALHPPPATRHLPPTSDSESRESSLGWSMEAMVTS